MNTINSIQIKALLMDTITFLKFGRHLSSNYVTVKKELCNIAGQKNNISANQLLNLIGLVYRDNNKESEFWQIIDKFNAHKYL